MKGQRTLLDEFFQQVYWPSKNIRESTASDYKRLYDNYIFPKFGKRFLTEIHPDEWSDLINSLLTKGLSKARANRLHAVASVIYKVAMKRGYVNSNPLQAVDWFKLDIADFDYWQSDEMERFLIWALNTKNPRFTLYHLAYETGLRVSELIALQRDCVDLHNDIIQVRRTWCRVTKKILPTTKSGHKRFLGINPGLKGALQKQLQSHNGVFVFHHPVMEHISYNTLEAQFQADIKKAKMRRITIHDLRHTFASHYMMNGGNIYDLKSLMGHSDLQTTMRYAHLAPQHLKAKSVLVNFSVPVYGDVVAMKQNTFNHISTIENENDVELNPRKAVSI